MRLLRHPHILKFIGVAESERHIRIFTEDVLPLDHCIDNLENFEIISGLHNVLEALVFLHEKVSRFFVFWFGCLVVLNVFHENTLQQILTTIFAATDCFILYFLFS